MKSRFLPLIAGLCILLTTLPAWANTSYIQISKPFIKVLDAPTANAKLRYTSYQGIYFNLISEKEQFYEVALLDGTTAWIQKENATLFKSDTPPSAFKTGIVTPLATLDSVAPVTSPPTVNAMDDILTLFHEVPTPSEKTPTPSSAQTSLTLPQTSVTPPMSYTKKLFALIQEDEPEFEYPEVPKDLNLDINGFYETKLSMRDYSPKTVSDKRWDTIRNDPYYQKLPQDVLVGDPKLDIRYQIKIDGQINEKLSVHYDVEQEPDFPGKYDIVINYDKSALTFHHFDADFQNGEFINVKKSLNGIKATSYDDNWEMIFATGQQRSEPQKMETFGSGQRILRLKNRSILEGSLKLYINNKRLSEGSDYTIDHYEGLITFTTITPQTTDFIKAIYEFTNPIEDFIPALSRKSFTGYQAKWTQDTPPEVRLLSKISTEKLWPRPKESSQNQSVEFDTRYKPINPSSEKITLNGRELDRNKHYTVKNQRGKIVLNNISLIESDTLNITYDYLETDRYSETIIGNNSMGPYPLSNTHILEESEVVYANNIQLTSGVDYKMDYIGGRLIFYYKVPYPTIITIDYQSIKSTTVLKDVKESPFSVGISYLTESVKADEQDIVKTIKDTLTSPPSNNVITLSNFPILASQDITVLAGTQNIAFKIENAYRGEIVLLETPTTPTISVTYSFQKSFSTVYPFNTIQGKNNSWYTETELNLRDVPLKYNTLNEIRLYGPIEGRNTGINEFIRLEQGIDYEVNYDENSADPGVNVQIRFLTQNDTNNSATKLVSDYPNQNNRITMLYEFTPQTSPDEGNISQTMIGLTAGSKLSKNWEVSAEIALAEHNFSKPREATASAFRGNGQLNHTYAIGRQNLVEDSETVTISDQFVTTVLTKDQNYFINYRNGTIRFKDITPSLNHTIQVEYQFFTTGAVIADESSGYKMATKVSTVYKDEKLKAHLNYKTVDPDFVPIGDIKDAKGSTTLYTELEYAPTLNESYAVEYESQKLLRSAPDDDKAIYLNREDIRGRSKFSMFDIFDNTITARQLTETQDKKPDQLLHDIDTRTTELGLGSHFGPSFFRNTLLFTHAMRENDFLDRVNLQQTNINNVSYQNAIKLDKRKYLGDVSISNSLYLNSAKTTVQTGTSSSDYRHGYATTLFIAPTSYFKNQLRYSLDTIQTESETTTGITKATNEIKNFLYDVTYQPTHWLDTRYQYNRREDQSPLLDQKGEINETNLFEIRRFAPKGMFTQWGLSQNNLLNKTLNNSFFTYSTRTNTIDRNNNTSNTNSSRDAISYNNFEPLKGIEIKRTYYETDQSNSNTLLNSTTASSNSFNRDTLKYGGNLVVNPEWPLFKHFIYTLDLEESEETKQDFQIANSATSNVTNERNPFSKRYQKLSLRPQHIKTKLSQWMRTDIGPFNASLEERLEKSIRSKNVTEYSSLLTKDPLFTEDSSEKTYYTLNADYAPFNRFRLTGSVSPGEETYVRKNIASASSGSIFKSILNGNVGLSFNPFKIVTIDTTYHRNRVNQFTSPSINITKKDIQNGLSTPSTPIGVSNLYNREEIFFGKATFKTFKNLDLSVGERITTIFEQFTTSNMSQKTITQAGTIIGALYRPLKGLTINGTAEFKQTEDTIGNKGDSTTYATTTKYDIYKSRNFSVKIEHTLAQTKGVDINRLSRSIQESGSGEVIQSTVSQQDYTTQTGSISANIIIPMTASPYIDNFTFTAEGVIKSIDDKITAENSYDITGIVIKGVLNF